MKTENFCTSKETITRVKRTHRMEDYFGGHSTDKGLISRIYKELNN
jgi:hypothetical protein